MAVAVPLAVRRMRGVDDETTGRARSWTREKDRKTRMHATGTPISLAAALESRISARESDRRVQPNHFCS